MYYEINVSLNGRHLFATAERSIKNHSDASAMWDLFLLKFPTKDGYQHTMSRYDLVGETVAFTNDINKCIKKFSVNGNPVVN